MRKKSLPARHSTHPGKSAVIRANVPVLIQQLRQQGLSIVFTNGCFDIVHSGHVRSLQQAKAQGDVLIVGVNSDESIRRLKGSKRPIIALEDRCEVLAALECVDYVVPFDEDTAINIIKLIAPDKFVKAGYTKEQLPEAPTVESLGGKVVLLDLIPTLISTTIIIERIRKLG